MWVALLVAALAQQPLPDAFVVRHDAAAALNPLSSRFAVALEGDRRSFPVGESIRLVLTYDGIRNRRFLQGRSLRLLARTVLDHTDGTSDPLAGSPGRADRIGGDCGCSEGGVPPIISNIIEIEITRKAAVRHR